MQRSSCALGWMVMGLLLAGAPIAAQEPPAADPETEEAPSAELPAPPPPPISPVAEESEESEESEVVEVARAIRVFGEVLFLKPTLDDTYFVIRSATAGTIGSAPSGERLNDEFDYEPAFRIGAGYAFPESGREVELSYTRLDAEASESVGGSFLWATRGSPNFAFAFGPNTGGYPGSASAEIDAEYQRIAGHVTHPFDLAGIDAGLQIGFEWADFRVGEDYAYADSSTGFVGAVGAASRTWGIGPEVGLDLGYEFGDLLRIPGAFSLQGGASIGLLLSETHTRADNIFIATPVVSLRDDETSRVITVVHARVGVGYEIPLAERIAGTVGVGYQIDTHLRGLTRVEFIDDVGRSLASTDYYDFDLQGVYASFGVVF